uniref:Adenylate kinase active site lid domain-containing protein n=1 Tax=Compsopogon caeruleus TaxID=31354 RepID=A0A7S1XGD0_9RHOD|mmetsp:Transcript_5452/g.11100  ORF Transcript_5452/g.11100 Transcript_5452/m.11100 type:complete len:411 (+) Transcript_5452:129-1361(+)|eukprot:CAMPEP_0184681524 /NCGR_PEP_ID=MMETSP0312-20130426/4514_1 /TAXON_ID=31354 /ORGANISM="Compsopogon coeruleus, Strain SAG 36.94" /LENGTH=410 /DNA_ID=CAMNT_0027132443 /DNA_START=105 /DNA_END=1337 /DNA_ORIENTATION=+
MQSLGAELAVAGRRAAGAGPGCAMLGRASLSPARGAAGCGLRVSPSLESGMTVIRLPQSVASPGVSASANSGGLLRRKSVSFDEGLDQIRAGLASAEAGRMWTKAMDAVSDFDTDDEGEDRARESIINELAARTPTSSATTQPENLVALAKEHMDAGKLVPDSVVVGLLEERMKRSDCVRSGWILDGFPRNMEQVHALARRARLPHLVVHMEVEDEEIIERILHRKVDPVTGKIYNTKMGLPQDPVVAKRLTTRADDNVHTVRKRLAAWRENHDQVIAAFSEHGVDVVHVPSGGAATQQQVYDRVRSAVFDRLLVENLNQAGSVSTPGSGPLNIVFVGKPGCGKGTQSTRLSEEFGLTHLSTGDMLREVCADKPPLPRRDTHASRPRIIQSLALDDHYSVMRKSVISSIA